MLKGTHNSPPHISNKVFKAVLYHEQRKIFNPRLQLDFSDKDGTDAQIEGMETPEKPETNKLPFMCTTCGMEFRHKSSLEVHEYSHKGKDDTNYLQNSRYRY